jgi:D-alanyl-lipoteichoic acid acyltransferase DltB (MBOAT superfamily)
LLWPLLQLGLILLLIYQYRIESQTFFQIFALAAGGFAVHALLPLNLRLPFFVLISFAGIGLAFGWRDGGWLILAGITLISICHLPIRVRARVAILLVAGSVLAMSRGGLLASPWSAAVWPILASMFMFRLAVYLYALQHDRLPFSASRTLAYFFMLPNVTFPLFPVVDFGTFSRTYFDRDASEIYNTGIRWIVRGVIHLLLYRVVYLTSGRETTELATLGDVVAWMLSTFLLYLRVSGQFHLIVGMLHLYGFRLPETHRLYYLASSFTDFWRRINIYWKDFMMKVVYYPTFFRLRSRGDRSALIGATMVVFVATWLLHSYQWFWLRGGFPIIAQDALFWGVLGGLVVVNALRESKRGRKRTLAQKSGWDLALGARTAVMFWGMTVLWSLWSSHSLLEWLQVWPSAINVDVGGLALFTGVTGLIMILGARNWNASGLAWPAALRLRVPAGAGGAALVLTLLFLGHPAVYESARRPDFAKAMVLLRSNTLNARDLALQQRGYYENLDSPSRLSTELWNTVSQEPVEWVVLEATEAYRQRADFLRGDLVPSVSIEFKGQRFSTNQWGMRDREYSMQKPPDTYRIAVMGPSFVMGSGVADGEPFEAVLEEELNARSPGPRFEVLNFGVANYSLLQQLALLDERVWDFEPDAVIITMTEESKVTNAIVDHISRTAVAGISAPYPELQTLLTAGGVEARPRRMLYEANRYFGLVMRELGGSARSFDLSVERNARALVPDIVEWSLRHIAAQARSHGAVPVLLGLDIVIPSRMDEPPGPIPWSDVAAEEGFHVMNLFDVYNNHDVNDIRIGSWDNHPNRRGNELIGEALLRDLVERADELNFPRAEDAARSVGAGNGTTR